MTYARLAVASVIALLAGLLFGTLCEAQSVVVTDFDHDPPTSGASEIPKGWTLKVWQGHPDVRLVGGENGKQVLRMRSDKAAVSIYREIKLDLKSFPILNWRWKVTKLPRNADARDNKRDDQAAGVYVIFPRFPTFINSQLIGYVWDTTVPAGTILKSRKNPMVHYIVVRSGVDNLDKWLTEKRNVLEDYHKVFGKEPPKVGGVSLMIDTDDTRSEAESYFARIEFNDHVAAKNTVTLPNNRLVHYLKPKLVFSE